MKNCCLESLIINSSSLIQVLNQNLFRFVNKPKGSSTNIFLVRSFAVTANNLIISINLQVKSIFLKRVLIFSHGISSEIFFPIKGLFALLGSFIWRNKQKTLTTLRWFYEHTVFGHQNNWIISITFCEQLRIYK